MIAEVRVGGHPGRVVLDFSTRSLGLIQHVEMPFLLGLHPAASRAVIELLGRAQRGEAVTLPADLSDEIRSAAGGERLPFEPLPAQELSALEAAADQVDAVLVDYQGDSPRPGLLTLELRVDGELLRLVVEAHVEPQRVPYFKLFEGPDLSAYPPATHHAIARLVYRAQHEQERSGGQTPAPPHLDLDARDVK